MPPLTEVHRAGPSHGPVGAYVHVPYCQSRCGYCDFNTYTASELGPGVRSDTYVLDVKREIDLVAQMWRPGRSLSTVFFGGGTPTLLPATDLAEVLDHLEATFGLADDVEVTTEANPESVDLCYLTELRQRGFTRLSLGMQSASPRVLKILDRRHTAGRIPTVVSQARQAGFRRISLDLIYGTPGESAKDWEDSLAAVIAADVDHVSAYALTVEHGTAMGAAVRRGVLPAPDPDVAAARYEAAEEAFTAAGLSWYEISNWAKAGQECRHNLNYWNVDAEWWGFGPGAHSYVGGIRSVNVKHPRTYAQQLASGRLPVADYEEITPDERRLEALMLAVRLRQGLTPDRDAVRSELELLVSDGLMARQGDAYVLTLPGRLLGDAVTLRLAQVDD